MNGNLKLTRFAKYTWFVLAFNIVVIVWGVFLRASKSGDGCGQHWLTCHGEIIPSAPEMKTIIEFSHRLTSGIAFLLVAFLLYFAFRKYSKGNFIRKTAFISFIFIVTEALVGAGLVLTGNTAENLTAARPFWMIGHLSNTFILLAFLTITAWVSSGGKRFTFNADRRVLFVLFCAVAGILLAGSTGSIAALSNMLFPSESLSAGLIQDLDSSSHILLRLRIFHPISSIIAGVFLIFAAGWLRKRNAGDIWTNRFSNALSLLVLMQLVFGALTLLTGAPIIMQLVHLFLADSVWIAFVLLSATVLAHENDPGSNVLK